MLCHSDCVASILKPALLQITICFFFFLDLSHPCILNRSIYREHCEAFLEAIMNLEFNTIESLWREFWRSNNNNNGDECEDEKYLSKYDHLY